MNTKEFLTQRIQELEKELNGLKRALLAYENNVEPIGHIQTSNTYDGTWIENILTVIKNKNRFLHNAEIAEELYETYSEKDKVAVKRRISAVLSNAYSKGEIESLTKFKFTKSIKDTVWGKKEWINEEGKIKDEYIYTSKSKNKNNKTFDF